MKQLYSFIALLTIGVLSCSSQGNGGASLDAASFQKKLNETKEAQIIDVRTPGEFVGGFIPQAVNIDYNSGHFEEEVQKLDKSKQFFVYCLSGGRSSSAADYMRSNGFNEVYDLTGGIMAWNSKGYPIVTKSPADDKISMEEYKTLISKGTVLIDFYAPWCTPCKKMEPMLNELSEQYKGKATILRINIDENKNLAKNLRVEEIPVLKIYKNGKETWMHRGLVERNEIIKNL
jgi:thioredoxin